MSIRLCMDSYIESDIVGSQTVSSEQTAFPATNATNINRRSKVWRTNGYWEITSSNNVLIFEETAGVNLTATVAVGNYSSTATFMTALKTALEDAGASTYTITQNSNFRFVIVSNGAGGGGILNLEMDHASTTIEGILGFDSTFRTGALTYTADELKINAGNEFIKWDMALPSNPHIFILSGPRNEPLRISPNATITLEGNETDSWSSPSYTTTLTYDDEVIYKQSDDGLHTEPLRYWRVKINDQNPLGYIEVGIVYLGDYTEFENGKALFPLESSFIDRSKTVYSEGGQTFSDIEEVSQKFDVSWKFLSKDEIETFKEKFDEFGTHKPFFVVFDKNTVFSTLANRMIRYCKLDSPPSFELEFVNQFNLSATFREEL